MNQVKIINKNNYSCLASTHNYRKGDVILLLEGIAVNSPNKYSVQVNATEHILPNENTADKDAGLFKNINHNCSPNAYFNLENRELIALQDIASGEEITYNYNTTEYDMRHPFTCNCKSISCIKEIKGYKHLTIAQQQALQPYLAPHLKNTSTILCL